MNVEIVVIGDELLIGQVVDTNSNWIAREMNKIGWEITEITTVRDRKTEMLSAFEQAFSRVDIVLVTGGLGPTKDDITKQTLLYLMALIFPIYLTRYYHSSPPHHIHYRKDLDQIKFLFPPSHKECHTKKSYPTFVLVLE